MPSTEFQLTTDWSFDAPVAPVFALTLLQLPHLAPPPMAASAIDPHAPTAPFRPPIA